MPNPPSEQYASSVDMAYLQSGDGPHKVVLLHGWGAFKEIWWLALEALAPHAQALAPDLPGHGGSPLNTSDSMAAVAERVAGLCASCGLERVTLVGHSMGGNIAVELALNAPKLVERLVLVDPAALPNQMPAYSRTYLQQHPGWAALRIGQALGRVLSTVVPPISHRHSGGIIRTALRRAHYAAQHDPLALRRLLNGLFANDLAARLGAVRVPTLVVSGMFDRLVPPELARKVAEAIPDARYEQFRLAAHNPMDERPKRFQRALMAFLLEDV